MADKPDEELVLAAMRGDVDSFMLLCHRYYSVLVAIAQAVLNDRHLAEDAAQEALANACRGLCELKSPNRFGAWLTAICRNKARDMLRREGRAESLGERDVPAEMPRHDPDVEAVRITLDSVALESRELLYLRYRNDLSYQAIGALLGISPEAVHGRLRRAREEVREHVERQWDRRPS